MLAGGSTFMPLLILIYSSMLRINLWSGPRNVSTALMYSFAQRRDTLVVDEPLYAHYLHVTGLDHPGRSETLASQQADGNRVVREVVLGDYPQPVVLFKHMAKHLVEMDEAFLAQTINVFLIRDPRLVLQSYAKVIEAPQAEDVGYRRQYDLWRSLLQLGQHPIVLDGSEIRKDPEAILRELCRRLGLAFDQGMLRWPAGPRPEDGVWAKYWYAKVHRSTGFKPYEQEAVLLPPALQAVAEDLMPYYEPLFRLAIKAHELP
jgi:hypothetical protein